MLHVHIQLEIPLWNTSSTRMPECSLYIRNWTYHFGTQVQPKALECSLYTRNWTFHFGYESFARSILPFTDSAEKPPSQKFDLGLLSQPAFERLVRSADDTSLAINKRRRQCMNTVKTNIPGKWRQHASPVMPSTRSSPMICFRR